MFYYKTKFPPIYLKSFKINDFHFFERKEPLIDVGLDQYLIVLGYLEISKEEYYEKKSIYDKLQILK